MLATFLCFLLCQRCIHTVGLPPVPELAQLYLLKKALQVCSSHWEHFSIYIKCLLNSFLLLLLYSPSCRGWNRSERLAEGLAYTNRKMIKAIMNCSSLCQVPGHCPLFSAADSSRKHRSRQISSGILNSFVLAIRRS